MLAVSIFEFVVMQENQVSLELIVRIVVCMYVFSREMSDLKMVPSGDYAGAFMHTKLLQFHENYRPAYYGTWRKHSSVISGRRPWQCDTSFFAYDVDSDEEWEEEEPGESLSHSEVLLQNVCVMFLSKRAHSTYKSVDIMVYFVKLVGTYLILLS